MHFIRYAVQRWPETKRLLGLLVNSAGRAHGKNARRLVQAARKQDRRLTVSILAAAVAHTPEGEEVLRGARMRMARKPSATARELLRNFPKSGKKRRRKKKGGGGNGQADGNGGQNAKKRNNQNGNGNGNGNGKTVDDPKDASTGSETEPTENALSNDELKAKSLDHGGSDGKDQVAAKAEPKSSTEPDGNDDSGTGSDSAAPAEPKTRPKRGTRRPRRSRAAARSKTTEESPGTSHPDETPEAD